MKIGLVALAALLSAGLCAGSVAAQPQPAAPAATNVGASLNISPKRMTLDRTRRNQSVFVLNQGNAAVTVDVALVDRVMLRDGQILSVEDAAKIPEGKAAADVLKSAKDNVQISPRRVTLQPGKGQTIRLRLSTVPEAGAEHRSHLTVTTIPPRDTGTTAESAAAGAAGNELRFQITAIYGISIPIIVRTADAEVSARLENARIEYPDISVDGRQAPRRTPVLSLDLVRGGASSLYGNFEVHVAGAKKGADPIGLARGVGLYPEIDRRVVRIPLTRAPAQGEKLEVTFTDDDRSPGKVLATAPL